MKNKKVNAIVQTAVIAAMYAALTYAQNFILPGSTSAAVQFRISEALNILALFTPCAIPGLTIGCILSNIYNIGSGLPLDMIFGSLASLLAAVLMYLLRNKRLFKLPVAAALMPALANGILVGFEIEFFFVEGGFHFGDFLFQGGCVALGELGVLFVLGLPLARLIEKQGLDKKLLAVK